MSVLHVTSSPNKNKLHNLSLSNISTSTISGKGTVWPVTITSWNQMHIALLTLNHHLLYPLCYHETTMVSLHEDQLLFYQKFSQETHTAKVLTSLKSWSLISIRKGCDEDYNISYNEEITQFKNDNIEGNDVLNYEISSF